MKINVEFFGQLVDITNTKSCEIISAADTEMLLQKLNDTFPALRSAAFIIAVNNSLIKENTILEDGVIVSLMPPYSGG
ncbi:MAG: MoaD/ThiS family protein [Ferruginibacter sp.]